MCQVPANGEQIEADIEIASLEAAHAAAAAAVSMAGSRGTLRRSSSTLSRNSLLSSRRNSAVSGTPLASNKHQHPGRRRRNSSVFEQGGSSLGSSFDEPISSSTSLCGKRSFKLMAKMRSVSRDHPRITITRAPTLDQSGRVGKNVGLLGGGGWGGGFNPTAL